MKMSRLMPRSKINRQKFDAIISDQDIKKDLSTIKKKWKDVGKRSFWKNPKNVVSFHKSVSKVLLKHNIPLHWTDTISNHLLYGSNFVPMANILGVDIKKNPDGSQELLIRCTAETKQSDIKAYWKIIQMTQKRMKDFQSKNRPLRTSNTKRNKLIYKLHSQNKEVNEIADALAENNYFLSEDAIRKIIKRKKDKTFIQSNKSQE